MEQDDLDYTETYIRPVVEGRRTGKGSEGETCACSPSLSHSLCESCNSSSQVLLTYLPTSARTHGDTKM